MKTSKTNFTTWDAFVSFMEDVFYPGIIEESTSEFIDFHWIEYQKTYC